MTTRLVWLIQLMFTNHLIFSSSSADMMDPLCSKDSGCTTEFWLDNNFVLNMCQSADLHNVLLCCACMRMVFWGWDQTACSMVSYKACNDWDWKSNSTEDRDFQRGARLNSTFKTYFQVYIQVFGKALHCYAVYIWRVTTREEAAYSTRPKIAWARMERRL